MVVIHNKVYIVIEASNHCIMLQSCIACRSVIMVLWCNCTHSTATTKRSSKIHSGVVHMLDTTPCVPQAIVVNEAFIPLVAIILLLLAESSQTCIAVLPLCHRKTRARLSREHGGGGRAL